MANKHRGLPKNANYAQVLAAEKKRKDAIEKAKREIEIKLQADIQAQRMTWLMVISIADAYGFGAKRLEPFFAKLKENSEEFLRMAEENDYEYALEKLRMKAERVTGSKIDYMYEKELAEIQRAKKGGGTDDRG